MTDAESAVAVAAIERSTLFLMAIACAIAVSALYVAQPILPAIGETFGIDLKHLGVVPTVTQIGYAFGLFLIVPLADRFNPKRMVYLVVSANIASFAACALAPTLGALYVASACIGISAITAQIVIPAMSAITSPSERGRVLGALLGGMAGGLLCARVVSGVVAESFGWRSVFFVSMIADVALLVIVHQFLPDVAPSSKLPWHKLMASLVHVARQSRELQASSAIGFCTFAAFSAMWSTLSPLLAEAPYHYGPAIAGAFGLVGAVNIVFSSVIGTLSDRLGTSIILYVGSAVTASAFAILEIGSDVLVLLLLSLLLLDLGNRTNLIGNQSRVHAQVSGARSRANCIFMTSYFLGGAVGGYVGSLAAGVYGFRGVAVVGGLFGVLAFVVHVATVYRLREPA